MPNTITVPSPNNTLVMGDSDSTQNLTVFRENVANKLVRRDPNDLRDSYRIDSGKMNSFHLNKIAASIASEIRDNKTIMELLPDTKAIFNLMISTIKSPNTLIGTTLRWNKVNKPDGVQWDGDPVAAIQDWIENEYGIDSKLTEILWNVFCWRGSHPVLTLPETVLDEIINGQDLLIGEEFTAVAPAIPFNLDGPVNKIKNIGILKNNESTFKTHNPRETPVKDVKSLIKAAFESTTLITDNTEIIKRPRIVAEQTRQSVVMAGEQFLSSVREGVLGADKTVRHPDALDPITTDKRGFIKETDVFRKRKFSQNPILQLTNTVPSDRSFGEGIVIDLPSESVIPLGDMAYLVMLADGKPLRLDEHTSEYDSLKKGIDVASQDSLGGNIINNARDTYSGNFTDGVKKNTITVDTLIEEYGAVFDKTVKDVITDSKLAHNQDIHLPDMTTIHMMGMIRALRGAKTTLLIVPTHLMTYWCYEKDQYGTGISMLSKYKYLASQRITLRLAELMAKISNSVPRKEVLLHIDEDEQEPEQVSEMMMTACIDNLRSEYSIGHIDTRDIITNFVKTNTTIRPIHRNLPDHHMEVKDYTRSVPEPDKELSDGLRSDWYKALDTQPELVDEYYKPNFAVEYITKNIMQTKTTIEKQKAMEPHLNAQIKQMCYNLPQLYRVISDSISVPENTKYSKDDIIEFVIESLKVNFPRPEQAEVEATSEGFDGVTKFIRQGVEAYINDDMLSRMMDGEIVTDDIVKNIQGAIIALCQREWLEYGTTDTLKSLTKPADEEGAPAINITELLNSHSTNLISNLGEYAKNIITETIKRDKQVTKAKTELEKRLEAVEAKLAAEEETKRLAEEGANNPPALPSEEETPTPADEAEEEVTPPGETEDTPPEEETPPVDDGDNETEEETPPEENPSEDEGNPWDGAGAPEEEETPPE